MLVPLEAQSLGDLHLAQGHVAQLRLRQNAQAKHGVVVALAAALDDVPVADAAGDEVVSLDDRLPVALPAADGR